MNCYPGSGLCQGSAVQGEFIDEEKQTEEIGLIEEVQQPQGMLCILGAGVGCHDIKTYRYDFDIHGPDKGDIGHHGKKLL